MTKLLFLSHSHIDKDPQLEKFVKELRREVASLLGTEDQGELLFFDQLSIHTGEDWRARIAPEIASCKVLVALCSPAFAKSNFCERELNIFLRRLELWREKGPQQPLIPVVWVRGVGGEQEQFWPKTLERFQITDAELPADYADGGLRKMYRLDSYRSKRKITTYVLAKRIATMVLNVDLPAYDGDIHLDHVPSTAPASVRYRVSFLPLLASKDALDMQKLMVSVCGGDIPGRVLSAGPELASCLQHVRDGREVLALIVSPGALHDPLQANLLRLAGAHLGAHTAIFCPRLAAVGDPQEDAQLLISLRGALGIDQLPITKVVRSEEELATKLALEIRKIRTRLMEAQTPLKASSEPLLAAASSQGIQATSQPILVGLEGAAR